MVTESSCTDSIQTRYSSSTGTAATSYFLQVSIKVDWQRSVTNTMASLFLFVLAPQKLWQAPTVQIVQLPYH